MRLVAAAALCMLAAQATAAGPDPTRIESARLALVECRIDEPARHLNAFWVAQLRWLQDRALHETQVDDAGFDLDLAIVARLRHAQRFELADVYAAWCRSALAADFRAGLAQLRAGDPAVVRDAAWVPLLTPEGEYLGIGLPFIRQAEGWRLQQPQSRVLGRDAASVALSRQLGTVVRNDDDEEAFLARCLSTLPPAPMPRDASKALPDEPQWPDDQGNALGAAERLAILHLAEGRRGPPSVLARLLLAEVLLRSLRFDHAPAAGSPAWHARIARAEGQIERVRRHSVDWLRISPLLVWLARAHETGAGGLAIDPSLAQFYLDRAASTQDPQVLEMIATRHEQSWDSSPPSEDRPFDLPVQTLRCD